MNQSQGTSSLSSPDLPMKRKRGRPRKDENLVHGESMTAMPGPDNLKKNKQSVGASDDVEDEMVGQMVSGVIEGSFDAGYLLNVKVGDTETQLRGVVFLPGKFTPITPANDVAPHVKMCRRKEIPIPAVNLQSHLYGSARPSEQSNRLPVEVKQHIPAVPDQIPPCIQSGILESLRSQSSSFVIPPVDDLPKNDAPALGGKVIPQQSLEPGSQSTHLMAPSENDVVVEQDKVLEEVEPTTTMTGPNGVEVNKESKTETSSEPIGDIPCIETVCKDPPIQPLAVGSESSALVQDDVKSLNFELNQTSAFAEAAPAISIIPSVETVFKSPQIEPQAVDTEKSQLLHDEVKSLNLELNQAPVFAEPAPSSVILEVETVCKDPHIQPEDVSSEKSALVQDVVKSLNVEPSQTPPVFAASDPTSKAVENLMEEEAYSASRPSQMFGEETVASEGSIPSGVAEPHISTSAGAVDNMECDIADAIPPAQS